MTYCIDHLGSPQNVRSFAMCGCLLAISCFATTLGLYITVFVLRGIEAKMLLCMFNFKIM